MIFSDQYPHLLLLEIGKRVGERERKGGLEN
jgi:hypothetical protein